MSETNTSARSQALEVLARELTANFESESDPERVTLLARQINQVLATQGMKSKEDVLAAMLALVRASVGFAVSAGMSAEQEPEQRRAFTQMMLGWITIAMRDTDRRVVSGEITIVAEFIERAGHA